MMKLAEALQERADLQKRISGITSRLNANATVMEGESPAEDPLELLKSISVLENRLEELTYRINLTNCSLKDDDGVTMTEQLAKRDKLKGMVKIYQDFIYEASNIAKRYSRTEVKIVSTVKVKDLQKTCDDLSKQLRELDASIQAQNWASDLL